MKKIIFALALFLLVGINFVSSATYPAPIVNGAPTMCKLETSCSNGYSLLEDNMIVVGQAYTYSVVDSCGKKTHLFQNG